MQYDGKERRPAFRAAQVFSCDEVEIHQYRSGSSFTTAVLA